MPSPHVLRILQIAAVAIVLVIIVVWFVNQRRRRKLLQRVRDDWGRVRTAPHSDWAYLLEGRDAPPGGLDHQTWSDLDLDRVIPTIDRTLTWLGRWRLLRQLSGQRAWEADPDAESLVAEFGVNAERRDAVGLELALAGSSAGSGLDLLTNPNMLRLRWWYWGFPLLSLSMIGAIVLLPIHPRMLLVVAGIAILNLIIRAVTARDLLGVLHPMRQLGPALGLGERLLTLMPDGLSSVTEARRHFRSMAALRRAALWVSRDPATDGELAAGFWEFLNQLLLLDANALLIMGVELRRKTAALAAVIDWMGMVDVARSVASLRAEPRVWSSPAWDDDAVDARLEGAWHPMLDQPVPNDAELGIGGGMLITGANMAGKSTYLRTVALGVLLSHCLGTCPAQAYRGRRLRVMSLIGVRDDLLAGKSHFQVESERVAAMLAVAREGAGHLFILDELFRGTNTIERMALTEAVMHGLVESHQPPCHAAMVATHDVEVASAVVPPYRAWHFRETFEHGTLSFDHLRREGPATTRTGIRVLEAAGAPPEVIADAERRAGGGGSTNRGEDA